MATFSRRICPFFPQFRHFLVSARGKLGIDIARTLPAKVSRMDPAPQCAGADNDALCMQMCGEQWHGPGVGVIPELARVARQQLTELLVCQGRRHAWSTGSFAISQRGWRSFGQIALDPAIDRAAFHTRMLGNDGNRLTFGNLGNCPKAPIKSGVVRLLKRSQQASTLRPTERRIARSGCGHPDTIGSARACRKTSGYLLIPTGLTSDSSVTWSDAAGCDSRCSP